MIHLGFIDTEGGPLVLLDAMLAQFWSGIEGIDYGRACNLFDLHPSAKGGIISIESGSALVWETGGAGTVDVYKTDNNGFVLVRAWLSQNAETSVLRKLADKPVEEFTELGGIEIASGSIAILWATESGRGVDSAISEQARRPKSLNLVNGGLVVPSRLGKFEAIHDSVKLSASHAQRLHLHT